MSPERGAGEATAALWGRRGTGSRATPYASALTGIDMVEMVDTTRIALAASVEATLMLDHMELAVRTLTTTIETSNERCVGWVRGPVLWSETITARANSLGNDDVFVCSTTSRSFDTVENRVLVSTLDQIAKAERALRGPSAVRLSPEVQQRASTAARRALVWLEHPSLKQVRTSRLSTREATKLRGGHRVGRMAPVMAARARAEQPFSVSDLVDMCDEQTLGYHEFVEHAIDLVTTQTGLPSTLTYFEGGLWSGALSFRHPSTSGDTESGLRYRGIALLPRADMIEGTRWSAALPTDGVRINTDRDLLRLLDRLSGAGTPRNRRKHVGTGRRLASAQTPSI